MDSQRRKELAKKKKEQIIKKIIMGIKERIQAATSEKEVDTLLQQGKCLTNASEAIKRRWQRVAEEALSRINKDKNNAKKEKK
tara:strand:+ start:1376 stop:1624 length:249 start_codon:yes stop_codon:yes gene_type:complete